MITEWLTNTLSVRQIKSDKPNEELTFTNKDKSESITLSQLIKNDIPSFRQGATDQLSSTLFNGHMQTCYTGVKSFDNIDQINYKRYIIEYPHGGEGALDFVVEDNGEIITTLSNATTDVPYLNQEQFKPPLMGHYSYLAKDDTSLTSNDKRPMMIMSHGLTGGSHESYLRSIIKALLEQGNHGEDKVDFAICVLNSRGCCQSKITTPQLYNGGWTNDLRYCVNFLKQAFPNRPFYMMGFSLGASIVTNYIGEEGQNSPIKCAMVMGTPWDLLESARFIDSTTIGARIYSPTLTQNLCKLVLSQKDVLNRDPNWKDKISNKMIKLSSVKQFDDMFTGPMFNYTDATDYYMDASPKRRVSGIRTPFISINSLDDPIVGGNSIPEDEIKANPFTMVLETNVGGHLGWFKDIYGQRWYPKPVAQFFYNFQKHITERGLEPINNLPNTKCPHVRTTFTIDSN